MKLTDEEIIIILKVFSPKSLLEKYMDGVINLNAKQINRLIKIKNGERYSFMTEKELEKITNDEVDK